MRALVIVFVSMIGLAGLTLVVSIASNEKLTGTTGQVLISACAIALGMALVLTNLSVWSRERLRPMAVAGIVFSFVAMALSLHIIWNRQVGETLSKVTLNLAVLAATLGFAAGLLQMHLMGGWRIVRGLTIAGLVIVCGMVVARIWAWESETEMFFRLIAVLIIAVLTGSVLCLVGRAIARKRLLGEREGVTVLRCPHCGEDLPEDLAQVFG